MADFTIKRNDTRPVLEVQLTDTVNGVTTPIDLTAATGVKLLMRTQGGQTGTAVNSACTFIDRPTGWIRYTWISADTATAGLYWAEFQITWTDGGVETVPNDVPAGNADAFYVIEIKADLGS